MFSIVRIHEKQARAADKPKRITQNAYSISFFVGRVAFDLIGIGVGVLDDCAEELADFWRGVAEGRM